MTPLRVALRVAGPTRTLSSMTICTIGDFPLRCFRRGFSSAPTVSKAASARGTRSACEAEKTHASARLLALGVRMSVKALGDAAILPAFFAALAAQWRHTCSTVSSAEHVSWVDLDAARPPAVDAATWCELFEYVSLHATLLLGAPAVLRFVDDLCDPERFTCVGNALQA